MGGVYNTRHIVNHQHISAKNMGLDILYIGSIMFLLHYDTQWTRKVAQLMVYSHLMPPVAMALLLIFDFVLIFFYRCRLTKLFD